MKKETIIGQYNICLNGKAVRTFVRDALWREASGDFDTEQEALNKYNQLIIYCNKEVNEKPKEKPEKEFLYKSSSTKETRV